MNNTLIAKVAVANATRGYDREYDYIVPAVLSGRAVAGARALVPFGRNDAERLAVILSVRCSDTETDPPASQPQVLKQIKVVIDSKPPLTSKNIELAAKMRDKYYCTWFDVFSCMLPAGWERRAGAAAKTELKGVKPIIDEAGLQLAVQSRRLNRIQQIRALELLLSDRARATRGIPLRDLISYAGISRAAVGTLVKNGYLEYVTLTGLDSGDAGYNTAKSIESGSPKSASESASELAPVSTSELAPESASESALELASMSESASASVSASESAPVSAPVSTSVSESVSAGADLLQAGAKKPLTLTDEQAGALAELVRLLDRREFSEALLHGVTGSGKTEVYMRLTERVIAQGRQVIVLVPEISLTPQMTRRFTDFFGDRVAIFHSRLSDADRRGQWQLVRSGRAQIALGARSAVFAPFDNLGAIVVDEEHESSYKSEMTPRYHAKEIARMRCERDGALLVYGSATPSVDLYYRAVTGDCCLLTLKGRANRQILPEVQIADMRAELLSGNRGMFSRSLSSAIASVLAARKQAILFLNRRGYSSFLQCRACGYIVSCRDCSVSFTYHRDGDRLICHYCGLTTPAPRRCPMCGSAEVSGFGAGTERVESEILKMFPECRVLRMDRDTTTGKDSFSRILDTFGGGGADILVGTQMVAKGHDFPNVTLVGVLSADSTLNFSDFRATERTFQLLTQVAGRSGRGETPGRVIIQTYNPDHFSITMARNHDYGGFFRQEMIARRALQYPPYVNFGVFMLTGRDDALVKGLAERLYRTLLAEEALGLSVMAPARPPVAKINERHRWRLIIKHRDVQLLEQIALRASDGFYKGVKRIGTDLAFDVNPYSML